MQGFYEQELKVIGAMRLGVSFSGFIHQIQRFELN
jgi:hypothetical protein